MSRKRRCSLDGVYSHWRWNSLRAARLDHGTSNLVLDLLCATTSHRGVLVRGALAATDPEPVSDRNVCLSQAASVTYEPSTLALTSDRMSNPGTVARTRAVRTRTGQHHSMYPSEATLFMG